MLYYFRILLTLFGGVINLKTGLLGRLFTMLNNVNDKFLDKLVGYVNLILLLLLTFNHENQKATLYLFQITRITAFQ